VLVTLAAYCATAFLRLLADQLGRVTRARATA
jgi:hypothetical protein